MLNTDYVQLSKYITEDEQQIRIFIINSENNKLHFGKYFRIKNIQILKFVGKSVCPLLNR